MDPETALERVHFFQGQILGADDFTAVQEYFLAKHRRHNRYLHGWGVVSGLQVTTTAASELVVEPGVAIDCAGNEIHLCAQVRLQLPSQPPLLFVALSYTESNTAPVPVPPASAHEGTPDDGQAFSRVREGYLLELVALDPASAHRGQKPGTPGCGSPHPFCIARLTHGRPGWKVKLRGRRRA